MDLTQIIAAVIMAAALLGATYTDLRYSKILNVLTVPAALLGIVVNGVGHGWAGVLSSVEGLLLGLALLPICGILGRVLGGGDIKLLAAVGALQGPYVLLWALAYTAVAGGVLAVLVALSRRSLGAGIRRMVSALWFRVATNEPLDIQTADKQARFPYAIAIALGSSFAVYVVQLR
jgi:prepilin peptidase CpaA